MWLRYAECLYMINKLDEAADAYEKVISLAPNHKIAKLNLSIILQRLGKFDGALESLDQSKFFSLLTNTSKFGRLKNIKTKINLSVLVDDREDLIDHDLLLERCKIFLNRDRILELYDTAIQLFSRHCPQIRDIEEAKGMASEQITLSIKI